MPFEVQRLLVVVDGERKPDISGLPDGAGIPLVAEVEVGSFPRAFDAEGEAGLGIEGAGVERGDDEGLGPGAC